MLLFFILACCVCGLSLGGDEFVDANAEYIEKYISQHEDAVRLPSGVVYRVIKEGAEGAKRVSLSQLCSLRYLGTTINGDMFTASKKKGQESSDVLPADLSLAGWKEALSLMKEGDHWEVVIPAHMGYGSLSKGKYVKPGATLVMDLEVHNAASSGWTSLYIRQAVGMAFMLLYAGYIYFDGKKKMGSANVAVTLNPRDQYDRQGNHLVYLKVAVGNEILDRVEIELFSSVCPRTAENFRCLCTGEKGMCKTAPQTRQGQKDIPLHFKDSVFHRVIPGFMCQGGDITHRDGTGGESIYGASFADEWEYGAILHSEPFLLSMANCGVDTNSSQFFLTTNTTSWLDRKHVVFGRVKKGFETVKAMEAVGSSGGSTSKLVRIIDCGEIEQSPYKEHAE
mmetsp:Transcript_14538/g.27206  ORF Transcript_14538/g.27206 Transcript_14538/m.27206 type:complete len:395 (-) Transcript_14538:184-1368(-)